MNRLLVYVLVGAFSVCGAYALGHSRAASQLTSRHEAEISALRADAAQRIANAQAEARAIEQQRAADMAALTAAHQEALRHATADRDRVIADLRAGVVRVREQFTCNSASDASGGTEARASGQRDPEGTSRGLSAADAEFLLRIAAEADEIVHQLHACQAVIRSDRSSQEGAVGPSSAAVRAGPKAARHFMSVSGHNSASLPK